MKHNNNTGFSTTLDTTLIFPFPFLFSIELTQEFPRWKLPQNFHQLNVQEIPICYLFIVYHVTSI